jgi:hypothetical protein
VTAPSARRRLRSFSWYHGLLAVALGLIAVMWVYALGFAPKGNPNRLHDKAWTANSESVCAAAQQQISALPPAKTAKSPQERAVVVDQANAVLADMIATLRTAAVKGTDKEQHYVEMWLADYDTYLGDRRDWATILHRGENKPFAISKADGGPILDRMDGFAETNNMPSCKAPLDV